MPFSYRWDLHLSALSAQAAPGAKRLELGWGQGGLRTGFDRGLRSADVDSVGCGSSAAGGAGLTAADLLGMGAEQGWGRGEGNGWCGLVYALTHEAG